MIDDAYIQKRLARLHELETQLADPAVLAQPTRFRDLIREHAALRLLAEKADRVRRLRTTMTEHQELIRNPDSDPELRELARAELPDIEKQLPAAEQELFFAMLPPDRTEDRNAILEIRAGTGGDEAALFAGDLFRMYSRFAEDGKFKVALIDASPSELGGFKEIVFAVEGPGAYRRFRYESGVHRVQRVPATEAAGRIHTSTATVAVFPEVEGDDDLELKPADLRIDLYCASGPGGQHVNKTASAVRITHIPTGIVAQSQDDRSQHRNRDRAMKVLKARVLDARRQEEEKKMGATRRSQIGSGDRSEKIRTYNYPQNRLTDHRINVSLYSLNQVMEGDLGKLVDALRANDLQNRLAAQQQNDR